MNALLLGCLVLGLLRLTLTGFGIQPPLWFYPSAAGMCLLFAALYQSEWCARHWMVPAVILVIAYLATLLVFQNDFLTGMHQLVNIAVERLNTAYSGAIRPVFEVHGSDKVPVFLALAAPVAVLWLAMAVLQGGMPIMMGLLVFPLTAALLLLDSAGDMPGLFMVTFGVVTGIAFSRTRRQRRMWGGDNAPLVHQNRLRFDSIQKTSALAVVLLCAALAAPGFLLVRPLLAVTLAPARELSSEVQTEALNRVLKLLPNLTAGQWNLNVQAIGGGVQDGAISSVNGYLLEGVEDLRLTVSAKPQDAIFLKGYVGVTYADGSWEPAHAYTFDGAAIGWNTEGSPRLFIQNLPFLRTAFALNQRTSAEEQIARTMLRYDASPVQLQVERLNANAAYTYVPYGTYLNDYYAVEAGDGAVAGQTAQEDRFFFFARSEMEEILEAWNGIEDTANVLDRVEESYRAFCNATCVEVPDWLNELAEEVQAVRMENRWQPAQHVDEITQWIRRYMAENYTYALLPDAVPEEEEPLRYFLFNSHRGNSVHFASAAVMLYRMFGVPARYVVGYEVPAALFTVQTGGVYTATAQGDQSQAWAEIYVPGIGWSPRDMTPGVIGTLEEVGPGGIRVEMMPDEEENGEDGAAELLPEMTDEDQPALTDEAEPNVPAQGPTLEMIVRWLAMAAVGLLSCGAVISAIWRLCRDLGWTILNRRNRLQRLLGVFQAVYRRLQRLKLPVGMDSQSADFIPAMEELLRLRSPAAAQEARPAVEAMYRSVYAGEPVQQADILRMRRILLALYKRARRQ